MARREVGGGTSIAVLSSQRMWQRTYPHLPLVPQWHSRSQQVRHGSPPRLRTVLNFTAAGATEVGRILDRGHGEYEPEVLALLVRLLDAQPNALFIDIGSNIGFFPLAILEKVREGHLPWVDIRAHEPLPALRSVAVELQEANALHYSLSSLAISNHSGVADLFVSAVSDASNSLNPGFRRAKGTVPVEVATLDSLYLEELAGRAFSRVVIKVDVESHEVEALEGAREILTNVRPVVICEVLYNRTEQGLSRLFREVRYTAHRYDGQTWTATEAIEGDSTYTYRDWLFVPQELPFIN